MSVASYSQVIRDVTDGRSLQAQVLLRCAMRLHETIDGTDLEQLFQAVSLNHKLWLLFYSEIEEKRVVLPPEVEANIRTLAAYVVNVSPKAFARDKIAIESLVTINRRIAAGLSANPPDQDNLTVEEQPQPSRVATMA